MALTPQEKLKQMLLKRLAPKFQNAELVKPETILNPGEIWIKDKYGNDIKLNEKQSNAVNLAIAGESFCLTGPAGSGKTTTVRAIVEGLLTSTRNVIMDSVVHKHLRSGTPGIISCSFTNKAVDNVKRNLPLDLSNNCLTFHKALEYEPVYYEITDESGQPVKTMAFQPARDKSRPLPVEIYVVIIEESTMLDVALWNKFIDALPETTHAKLQLILLGDIQQLPPVFGKSIFIHAMQRGITTIELTDIYRQALESPIISLATDIREGKQIPYTKFDEYSIDKTSEGKGKVTIQPWKKSIGDLEAIRVMHSWLPQMIDSGHYKPEEDIILTPFNKSFGTIALNEIVANHIAKKLGAEVWEIYTGIKKAYFRINERVLVNKSEARIISIEPNRAYYGKIPRSPSNTMDYKGVERDPSKHLNRFDLDEQQQQDALDRIDRMLESFADHTDEDSPTAKAASHKITVKFEDTGYEKILTTAGEINAMSLGYAITVYKAQGSEYRRVFAITHKSQAVQVFREMLYTMFTRAREELFIVCEKNFMLQGVNNQKVPGKDVYEKIAAFERDYKLQLRAGKGNEDYNPVGLERFIKKPAKETDHSLSSAGQA